MSEAIFRQNAGQQDYTPGSAVSAGEIVELPDGRAGVVKTDLAASAKGAVYTTGILDVLAATGTLFTAGDPVYWDISASLAVDAPGAEGDLYIGTAVAAKTSGQLVVRVDLNAASGESGGAGAARGVWGSRVVNIEHDDTAENTLIEAADNPNGLLVVAFPGVVTEAPVGSSEDQLEITLYDEDDNALSVMITTNTTPDAIGDLIQGTLTLMTGSTGNVAAVVPAGKSCYAKVSQATAGTPAGAIDVRVLVVGLT